MPSNRIDQVAVPGVLKNHEQRIRILEAVPGEPADCCITQPEAYSFSLTDNSEGGEDAWGYDLFAAGAVNAYTYSWFLGEDYVPACAWLQGGSYGPIPDNLTGNFVAYVLDATKFNADAQLGMMLTAIGNAGAGPYIPPMGLIGHGYIRQDATGDTYPFELTCDHFWGMFVQPAFGTAGAQTPVTSTSPITLADNDTISCFWQTFTAGWD